MELRNIDIRELRKRFNMSQEALARELGVSTMTVRRWELYNVKPSPLSLKAIESMIENQIKKKEPEWEG